MSTELPAGPELDRLIAEKVMGWSEWERPDCFETGGRTLRWLENDGSLDADDLFQPSANIAHAWEVVEHMRAKGMYANVRQRDQVAYCVFEDYEGSEMGEQAKAATAPLAICLAALKANIGT